MSGTTIIMTGSEADKTAPELADSWRNEKYFLKVFPCERVPDRSYNFDSVPFPFVILQAWLSLMNKGQAVRSYGFSGATPAHERIAKICKLPRGIV